MSIPLKGAGILTALLVTLFGLQFAAPSVGALSPGATVVTHILQRER